MFFLQMEGTVNAGPLNGVVIQRLECRLFWTSDIVYRDLNILIFTTSIIR